MCSSSNAPKTKMDVGLPWPFLSSCWLEEDHSCSIHLGPEVEASHWGSLSHLTPLSHLPLDYSERKQMSCWSHYILGSPWSSSLASILVNITPYSNIPRKTGSFGSTDRGKPWCEGVACSILKRQAYRDWTLFGDRRLRSVFCTVRIGRWLPTSPMGKKRFPHLSCLQRTINYNQLTKQDSMKISLFPS